MKIDFKNNTEVVEVQHLEVQNGLIEHKVYTFEVPVNTSVHLFQAFLLGYIDHFLPLVNSQLSSQNNAEALAKARLEAFESLNKLREKINLANKLQAEDVSYANKVQEIVVEKAAAEFSSETNGEPVVEIKPEESKGEN